MDRMSQKKKKGVRGFTCTEDCIDVSIQALEEYIIKIKERIIKGVSNSSSSRSGNRKTTADKKTEVRREPTVWTLQSTD